jgi:amidase
MAAVELGMRLIEPGFAAGSGRLRVARVRPETDPEVDGSVETAIDAALAAAGIETTEVAGLDFAAANAAGNLLIDVEAYPVNEYLMPDLARLSPYNQRNLPEAAAVTADQAAAANQTRASVREWFAGLQARHPFLALPTLMGAPPLIGERGRISLTLLTMPANLAGLPALALPVPGGPAGFPRPCSSSARRGARRTWWPWAAASRPRSLPAEWLAPLNLPFICVLSPTGPR